VDILDDMGVKLSVKKKKLKVNYSFNLNLSQIWKNPNIVLKM